MTDAEVKKEDFLEYINMILSTGEVPGLLAKDEKEAWLGDIRNEYVKRPGNNNPDPTPTDLWNYFVTE
jgi:dynein heavy chain